jgi:hypothetical protein
MSPAAKGESVMWSKVMWFGIGAAVMAVALIVAVRQSTKARELVAGEG